MKKFEPVSHFESEIKTWEDVLITSIFAAIGVNLLVSGLALWLEKNYYIVFIISGLFICAVTTVLFLVRKLKALETNEEITGFFAYDREKRDIIRVPGYEIEERMWLNMLSVHSDNKEIDDIWRKNEIGKVEFRRDEGFHIQVKITESDSIVSELIEYCILEVLSAHLIDYFSSFAEEEIKKLNRDDVPEMLKCNRILKWFSEPSGDEETVRGILFSEMSSQEKAEKLVAISRKKPFSRFEIVLPKDGLLIKRNDSIVIDHPLFSVELSSIYKGTGANIPAGFETRYLGLSDSVGRYGFFGFSITLCAKFKKRAFFSKSRKKYSLWIDSFAKRLSEFASSDAFFARIGWDTANTVIKCMNHFPVVTNSNKMQGDPHDQL